jgi:hypothetical protein
MTFHIERYRRTKFFGLYCNGSLLCVTAYRRGAIAVRDTMQALLAANVEAQARIAELLKAHQVSADQESSQPPNRKETPVHV